jgi:hypothetical protein
MRSLDRERLHLLRCVAREPRSHSSNLTPDIERILAVWGDVASSPRRVHASRTDATFVLDAPAELIAYEVPRA